jgi:hypothetical protein
MMEIKIEKEINMKGNKLNQTRAYEKMKSGCSPLHYLIEVLVPCGLEESPHLGTQATVKVAEVIPQLNEVHLLLYTNGL